MAKRDFYDILGIHKSASADEIKKAHRKLARQYHPDMNKDNPSATEKFKEVQEAYDILSDETKRRNYDQFGHAGVGAGVGAGGDPFQRGGGGPRGWPGNQGPMPGGGGGFNPADMGDGNFGDIFEQLFGGGGGRGRQKQRPRGNVETPRGADIETPVTITFYQAARGSSVKLQLNRDGRTETLDVKIPAGVKDGSRIRIKGRGDQSGGTPGDLFIITTVTPHAYYRRDGLDVLVDVPLTIWEAIEGARVTVPTLDGPVDLTIPPGTGSHAKLRIRGRGIFKGEEKGDQFVVVKIVIPKNLEEADKNTLREMALKYAGNPRAELGWDV